MLSDELLAVADQLYAVPVSQFTQTRDAVAKESADKDLAARIKALRKPSLAAWAVNLLVRRESDQIDQVLSLAESLRAAAESLDGDELRTLTRQRRQLTAALTTTARQLARDGQTRLTPAVADQIEGVLTAAMLDPVAAEVVRSGLLVTAFRSTGVSEVDVAEVCAVPEALGYRAVAREAPASVPPSLHVVPDDTLRREAAQGRVDQATLSLAEANENLQHQTATSEVLHARRLQVQGELDELRRQIAQREDDLEAVDEEIEAVAEAVSEAIDLVASAERTLATARDELDRIPRR